VSERLRSAPDALTETETIGVDQDLDLRGEVCPYTFLKARLALEPMVSGEVLRMMVDNSTSARDVPRSLEQAGHRVLVATGPSAGAWTIVVRRG